MNAEQEPGGSCEFRRQLLALARDAASHTLERTDWQVPKLVRAPAATYGGAFVTLWAGTTLRGCVGTFLPVADLEQTIVEVVRAALADPRFVAQPVTLAELPDLTLEVSLLSRLTPSADPVNEIVPGRHGIVIRGGDRAGCFLPKVAVERSWSPEEFLAQCCTMKAGLPAEAWRWPGTEVLLFTAEVFAEAKAHGG